MKYSTVIVVRSKEVIDLFANKDFSSDRAQVEKKETDEGLEFHINAKDSVALRAVCNSITKLLTVWEKMEQV